MINKNVKNKNKKSDKKRDKIVAIRLTDEEYINIKMKAEATGKNISAYLRELGMMNKVKPNNKDYLSILSALNRIGNNINQIAKALNTAKKYNYLDEVDYNALIVSLHLINKQLKKLTEK